MNNPKAIMQEIQSIEAKIFEKESYYINTQNYAILSEIKTLKYERDKKIKILSDVAKEYKNHSIKYAFKDINGNIELDSFLKNIDKFKKLLDTSYVFKSQGKRNKLPIFFDYVYKGSLGIHMSTPYEPKLFGSDYDESIEYVIQVLNELKGGNEEEIIKIVNEKMEGKTSLVRKFSGFFKEIYDTNKAIKIEWESFSKKSGNYDIEVKDAKRIYDILKEHEKMADVELELICTLKGISLLSYKFEVSIENYEEKVIRGEFNKNIQENIIKLSLNSKIVCRMIKSIEYSETTGEERKKYYLEEVEKCEE